MDLFSKRVGIKLFEFIIITHVFDFIPANLFYSFFMSFFIFCVSFQSLYESHFIGFYLQCFVNKYMFLFILMITLYNFKTIVSINFAVIKISSLMVSFVLHLFKRKDLASLYFPLIFTHWRLPFVPSQGTCLVFSLDPQ